MLLLLGLVELEARQARDVLDLGAIDHPDDSRCDRPMPTPGRSSRIAHQPPASRMTAAASAIQTP